MVQHTLVFMVVGVPAVLAGVCAGAANVVSGTRHPDAVGVPESMVTALHPELRPFCTWTPEEPSDANLVDHDHLQGAVEHSAAWIRTVIEEQHLPDNLAERIVGLVNSIDGSDVTRAVFEAESFRFLVTQNTFRIVVVACPLNAQGALDRATDQDPRAYLTQTVHELFEHGAAIEYFQKTEATGFGAQLIPDEELYDETGTPLSRERRSRISQLPREEASKEYRRLQRLHEERAREADPTLPRTLVGGARNYWWAQVYAITDGSTIALSAGKGYGGKFRSVHIKDWFRKDKLPSQTRRSHGAPMPPQDTPGRTDE